MYYPPDSFVDTLEREFRNRLRIRWSHQRSLWVIEQKVARGLFVGALKPTKGKAWDETNDRYVQIRDGVIEIMAVATGTKTACPVCRYDIRVPYYTTEAVECGYCKLMGRRSYIPVVYMPLNEDLIQYLKSIDPENPRSHTHLDDGVEELERWEIEQEKRVWLPTEARFEEDYRRIVGIPTAHLSGRTKFWKG